MKTTPQTSLVPLSSTELQSMWGALNATYFANRLPFIEIQWSTRLTSSVGLFVSRAGPRSQQIPLETRHGSGRVIRLSLPLLRDQSLDEIRGTLAHEMIHQWQFDVKKCLPSHGREFRRIMHIMNQDGLGITVYHALNSEVEALAKYAWQCLQCGRAYHRQRKRLSPKTHRCGYCLGELREVKPGVKWSALNKDRLSLPQFRQGRGLSHPIQLLLGFMVE